MLHVGHRFYIATSGTIFGLVAIAHGIRAFYEWDLLYNGWLIPIWVSWLVTLVGFLMALAALKHLR